MRKSEIIILGIVLLSFVAGVYFYSQMPERMASHWNAQGKVDGYMPKFLGLFLMPVISFVILLLFIIIPRIDPLKANVEKFRKYFDWFVILLAVFLFYLYILTIFWNLGFRFDLIRFLAPAFGLLFYYAGILTGNARRNWFIGIRTPWTLSSDEVWDKTHKIGAKLFKTSGSLAFLGILFPSLAIYLVIIPAVFSALFLIIYSYVEYRKQNTQG